MLVAKNIHKFFGTTHLIKDLSLTINPGELVGLVGPSGSGKSVLIKIFGGVLESESGTVQSFVEGNLVEDFDVGFLFQEGALFDSMSVIENVAFPLTTGRTKPHTFDEAMQKAVEILSEVGLASAINKLPGQLSGGMRKRVGIARALVSNPSLVLLDDPTGGLDPVAANVILDLIDTLQKKYKPMTVLVSHDIRRLLGRVDRLVSLFDGQIAYDGSPSSVAVDAPQMVYDFLATRYDFNEANLDS